MSERDAAREILRELLHEALAGGNGNGDGVVPQIPPPPVAAVHRPSRRNAAQDGTEHVTIGNDDDLNRFVRDIVARGDHEAILSGRLRFTLARGGTGGGGGPAGAAQPGVVRVARGAVTERTVEQAARAGARLVVGPGAVLTPLAREKARARGIEIERER